MPDRAEAKRERGARLTRGTSRWYCRRRGRPCPVGWRAPLILVRRTAERRLSKAAVATSRLIPRGLRQRDCRLSQGSRPRPCPAYMPDRAVTVGPHPDNVDMKFFISSVIGGFEAEREAAVRAVRALRHEVVSAQDFPAGSDSPQTACLAGVRQSDAVVLLLGERYGPLQASGLSATHEEYRGLRQGDHQHGPVAQRVRARHPVRADRAVQAQRPARPRCAAGDPSP